MDKRFTAVVTKEDDWYVAHCIELGVVSQGKTIEEAQANLKEAVELYLDSFGVDDVPEITKEERLEAVQRMAAMKLPVADWEQMERESMLETGEGDEAKSHYTRC